jgi:uncharacterized membrane protein
MAAGGVFEVYLVPVYKFASTLMAGMVVFALSMVASCGAAAPPTGWRTYSLTDKGIAHLSFEYPATFNITQVQLYDDTGYERMDLEGPYSRQTRDRTTTWVVAQRYTPMLSVGDLLQSALTVAGGLSGYRLIDRSTYYFNGITAEQITYFYYASRTDYERKILGLTPAPTVTRQVYFIANGLNWTVAMSADQSRVEADTPGFEHMLATFTLLP